MSGQSARMSLPFLPSLIPTVLVALGVVLWATTWKGWIIVCGLGAFGPGILRELGWLHDLDEFQREASRRAAYHAYLVGGMVTTLVITGLHIDGRPPAFPDEVITVLLVVFWLTWMFSYLMAYWGPQKTASRVLLSFGGFWLLFVVGDAIVNRNKGFSLHGLMTESLIVAPFLLGAYAAHRWPRATGVMLLVATIGIVMKFVLPFWGPWTQNLFILVILVLPLVASGLGLLRHQEEESDE